MEPLLPKPKSSTPKGGRPVTVELRDGVDVIFYPRAGGAWRIMPHNFPAWQTVYGKFRDWRLDGTWKKAHAALHEEVRIDAGAPPRVSIFAAESFQAASEAQ
ncbi:MAG: transposase [Planctomycetes bacterium]|nr:transposase [Planctomycetota bacterium]